MLTSQRKSLILDLLAREGQVIAKTIAADFDISEDTVRRDLRELAADGLLKRVHGGAMPLSAPLPDFVERQSLSLDTKNRLGAKAAALIQPKQLIFLDGGTTTAQIIPHLSRSLSFTVATHSPTIAAMLAQHSAIDIILIGGKIYKHSMVATGAGVSEAVSRLRPDLFFLGVTGVHPRHGFTTGDFEEAALKRHIAQCSVQTHVLVTEEKFGLVSPYRILSPGEVDTMIVPADMAHDTLSAYGDCEILKA